MKWNWIVENIVYWQKKSLDILFAGIRSPQKCFFIHLCPEPSGESIKIEKDAGATYLRSCAQFSLAVSGATNESVPIQGLRSSYSGKLIYHKETSSCI